MPKQKQDKRTSPQKAKTVAQPKSASKRGQTSRSKSCANNQSQRPGQIKATKTPPAKAGKKTETVTITIKIHSDKKGGHPHVVLENIDKNHVSVGLSTNPKKGKNSPNYKLTVNPLGGKEQSYMRRQGTVAPVGEYGNPHEGKMTPQDYDTAKKYGDKAKRKYIEKKNKKK